MVKYFRSKLDMVNNSQKLLRRVSATPISATWVHNYPMPSQPTADALSPADALEAQWVESHLIRLTMSNAGFSLAAISAIIPLFFALLYPHSWLPGLLAWALAAVATSLWRWQHLRQYLRAHLVQQTTDDSLHAYWRKARWGWAATGVVWGASMLLLLHLKLDQGLVAFVCGMVLVGVASASVNLLSATPDAFKQFNTAFGTALMGSLLHQILVSDDSSKSWQIAALATSVLIFLVLLRVAGWRLHKVQRNSVQLQYRNQQLIASLTRQTQAALDAVTIKDRFLASAAHDIRQPVHALGLYADWLHNEPELAGDLVPKIVESTKAVNTLFDSLFDLVRFDSGKVPIAVQPVDLQRLLADLELHYKPLASSKGLTFKRRCRAGTIQSDPILLQRLLGNLLSNAVKYTESGGVLLACRVKRKQLVIEIWDTGVGIEAQYHQKVFQEFYKVPTHRGTEDGFGLGLAIVSRLSTILGYPVQLDSRPGRGSLFRVQLSDVNEALADERAATTVAQLAKNP